MDGPPMPNATGALESIFMTLPPLSEQDLPTPRERELEWGQKLSWTIFEKGAKEDWEDVGQERGNLG